MAYINFYLDRPFDTSLPKDNVQQIINDCKNAKKHYPKSILNDKQTSLYLFFTYDTRKRVKIKTQIKVVAEDWDFFRGKYKYTRKGSLEMNNALDSLSHNILKQFTRLAEDNPHYQEADVK